MPEFTKNIWAPWRMEYIDNLCAPAGESAEKNAVPSGEKAGTPSAENTGTPSTEKAGAPPAEKNAGPCCFLCAYCGRPQDDAANHVLWRSPGVLVLLNRFPYTSGHVLVAPAAHIAELENLTPDLLLELALRLRDAKRTLQAALKPQGFNIGMNIGRCAGAGLPDHLHWHIVPRWSGDTNFMPVLGDVRVIPQALERTAEAFHHAAEQLGLPAGVSP